MSSTTESGIRIRNTGTDGVMAHYRQILRRRIALMLLLLLLIVASLLLDFVLGPSGMSLHTLWQTLTNPGSAAAGTRVIVWDIRTQSIKRSFFVETNHNIMWPIFKWSHDDQYFARVQNDALSISLN